MRGKQFRELVLYNVICTLKAESSRYALSYFWWIIEPALHFFILFFVFGIFFNGNKNGDFIPFLFCGVIPWFWFNKSISNGMESIIKGSNIIRDTYIPKYFFPIVSVISDAFKELLVFIILIIVLLLSGFYPSKMWLFLPLVLLLELLLITTIVSLVAILVPYLHDIKHAINSGLQILMFSTGTFYDYRTMPERFHIFYDWNPTVLLINMFRDILMYNKAINVNDYMYILVFVFCFGIISYFANRVLDKDVPKVLFR